MSYSSAGNTFVAQTLVTTLDGIYDSTDTYVVVRVWVNVPGNCSLRLYFADNAAGANEIEEMYPVYGNHVSSINSLVKKPYAKVTLTNETVNQQLNVLVRTKFVNRSVHPYLNYSTDDVTANVSISLDEINFNQKIDHSGASILCYGRQDPGTTSESDVPLRTDNCGNMSIVGHRYNATTVVQNDVRPVIIGGYSSDNTIRTIATDTSGYVKIISGDPSGVEVKPGTGSEFKISSFDPSGVAVKPGPGSEFKISSFDPSGVAVKPGTGSEFKISSFDPSGVAVKPGTGSEFKISSFDPSGVAVKPGTGSEFKISSFDPSGVAVKPGTGSEFKISSFDPSGVAVKPGNGSDFKISSFDPSGVAVKPGTNAIFNVSGDAIGLAVKPGNGSDFKISSFDPSGVAVKPGTNAIFNVSADPNGLAVKPGNGSDFKISSFDTSGLLVKYNVANYSNKIQGYVINGGFGNFNRVGTGNVNTIYSINLFNSNNTETYYVKFYSMTGTPDNNTETGGELILNYVVSSTARDIVFPRGIQVEGKPLSSLVSTKYVNEQSDAIAGQPVQITVSYL